MSAKILPLRRIEGSTEEMSDPALVAAVALGDRAALGALFDRHYDAVRGFLFHITSLGEADIDDLVQITFETVQKAAARFSGRSEVRTWILGIARNVSRRATRMRSRRQRIQIALMEAPEQEQSPIDEQLAKKEQLARLKKAIDTLSPKLKEAFVLVYVQGLSGTEAAKVLEIKEGAIWKRLHTARKQIREVMGGER